MSPALAVLGTFSWGGLDPSDFDFITSVNFATSSAVNINGCFSADYDHYLVMRNLLGSVSESSLRGRLRVGGVDATGADYRAQSLEADSTTVASGRSTGQTSWANALGWAEATSFGFSQTWISNPFGTVRTTAWNNASYDADGSIRLESTVFEHDLATSYDGITFYPPSGTVTGDVYVYGLAV